MEQRVEYTRRTRESPPAADKALTSKRALSLAAMLCELQAVRPFPTYFAQPRNTSTLPRELHKVYALGSHAS
jgi:hypothetical protein